MESITRIDYYEEVPNEVKQLVQQEVESLGYAFKSVVRQSNHPSDHYLYLVVGQGGYKNGYCTWLYNSSVGSLCEGYYDMSFKGLLLNLSNRLSDIIEQ